MRTASTLLFLIWCGACSHTPTAPTGGPVSPVVTPPVAEAPRVACPEPVTIAARTSAGVQVHYDLPEGQGGDGAVTVNCTPAPDTAFPIGTTDVECVVSDARQRSSSCRFAITVTAPARLRLARIMAFGDSITEGQVVVPGTESLLLVSPPETAYPTVLSQLLNARYTDQTVTVFNRGRATERSELALSRFVDAFKADGPDVVVLLEGYNDIIFAASSALGIDAAEHGVSVLAADARNRGARVFICTLSPSRAGRRQIPMSSIQAANDRLRVVARGEGARLVDVFSALLPDVDGNVGSDGLHLTPAGYRRVAETVFSAIRDDLEIK